MAVNVLAIAYIRQLDTGCEIVFRRAAAEVVGESFITLRRSIAVTIELVMLTATDGAPIAVNPGAVAYAQPAATGGLIVFGAGVSIATRESYDQIMAACGALIAGSAAAL